MNKLFASIALFALTFAVLPAPSVHAATTVSPGDLIRGESFSAVYYYGEDGFRYVFPNEKTYFTWYSNFDNVTMLTDAELGKIQIGGNVTYKPGNRLVKIQSDPKTYAVDSDGHLHWVETEDIAVGMLGNTWVTMIDDVPDSFFANYSVVWPFETTEEAQAFQMQFLAHDTITISDDKALQAPWDIRINDSGFSPDTISLEEWLATIPANTTFRFTNDGSTAHTATADDNSWGTGTLTPGESYLVRLNEGGVHTFHCSYHPSMTGSITTDDVVAW